MYHLNRLCGPRNVDIKFSSDATPLPTHTQRWCRRMVAPNDVAGPIAAVTNRSSAIFIDVVYILLFRIEDRILMGKKL